ncbi:PQQ-like beta-propeller repeat protein [Altericroceibacterium endophyticum]|uniref:PQQ-binding-like beta-propeller repeat protein n=1 Tax=Altericroceibacterium endophyticum TaxID=1808508 RepID=A0A6I4T886_9SPHN|nr:PQQ-like beta-propeller repeat protein [Altericroceibacterium endophyticum]MXO66888.1 PQQ-binding-like beta-propeller repeat protein [Altericroceibacterium endophyticum]
MIFRNLSAARSRIFAVSALGAALALGGCGVFGGGDDGPTTPTVGDRIPVLSRIANAVEPDPALADVSVVLPPARENDEWSQPGGNAANAMGHLALAAAPQKVWSASIPGSNKKRRMAAAPVVGGGKLFVMDTDATVHAFDAQTGASIWSHSLDSDSSTRDSLFGGGASYFGGKVYVTDGVGDVAALDAETGSELWNVKPAGPLRGSPTVAFNAVYVMTQDNQIHALNLQDGSVIWQDFGASGQSGVFGVAAPAAGQGTVIAGYSTGELVAYRYENGRNLWSDALARTSISTEVGSLTDVDADPIIDDGRVYALGQGGRMAAYELVTGQRLWELTLAGISTPAVAGEWIFTLTDDARLLAIARSTGKVKWITQLDRYKDEKDREGPIFWTGPVLANNKLWIASTRGKVMSVDVVTGLATEFTELSDGVSLPPIVANQTLYLMDNKGRITAWR